LPDGSEFQIEKAIEFRYAEDIAETIVFVPVACPIEFYAVYAFGRSGTGLGFMLSRNPQAPNQFSIRDASNQGIDVRYDEKTIRDVSVVPQEQSTWKCIHRAIT
jgi:hypothetical protein